MSTWLDKPDADGLWWKQVKSGIALYLVSEGRWQLIVTVDGGIVLDAGSHNCVGCEPAKWQRCELTKPEPYQPPQPPKVEQYTGVMKTWGERRFLTFVGHSCIISTFDAITFGAFSSDWVRDNYTDIKPLESPP